MGEEERAYPVNPKELGACPVCGHDLVVEYIAIARRRVNRKTGRLVGKSWIYDSGGVGGYPDMLQCDRCGRRYWPYVENGNRFCPNEASRLQEDERTVTTNNDNAP